MKKYIGVISGVIFALSIGIASAQIIGGGVQVTCVRYNTDGSCAQTGTSVNVQAAGGVGVNVQTGGVRPVVSGVPANGVPANGTPAGNASYQQGKVVRQSGNTADLSFITNLLAQLGGIISLLPPILLGVAVVLFFWFLIRYFIVDADKEEGREKAVKGMGYSLAAIFVMVTLWGIIAFFGDAIGINPTAQVNAPKLPR
ncbi:MAG: hypothetical protein KBD12_01275 [Candidatus Pacebacteria bacterium]|nr:hypothetical protein [Candidatus Paceibacterota bacterium]